jgi:hypothetical protein
MFTTEELRALRACVQRVPTSNLNEARTLVTLAGKLDQLLSTPALPPASAAETPPQEA